MAFVLAVPSPEPLACTDDPQEKKYSVLFSSVDNGLEFFSECEQSLHLPFYNSSDKATVQVAPQARNGRAINSPAVSGAVQFKNFGLWKLHKWLTFEVLLLIAAPSFLIALLLIQRGRRKRAEAKLRESEQRFRLVANAAPVMVWMSGVDRLGTFFNQPWLEFTGRSLSAELGNGWMQGVHAEDLAGCLDTYTKRFDRRESFQMEYRLRRHDGEYRWISDTGVPRYNADGSFAGYIGSCMDVTEPRLAAEAMRQEAAFHELMTGILSRFATCSSAEVDESVTWALQAVAEFIGADHAFVIMHSTDGASWSMTHEWSGPNIPPKLHADACVPLKSALNERLPLWEGGVRRKTPGKPEAFEERLLQNVEGSLAALTVPIRTKAGILGCIGLHCHAKPLNWSSSDAPRLRMVGDAVATALERKRSLQELQKSEEKFSKAFHSSPVAMTILSLSTGHYVDVNKACEQNLGYSRAELIDRSALELGLYVNDTNLTGLQQSTAAPASGRSREIQYRTRDGELREALLFTEMIEFGGEPCLLQVCEDITERKRSEKAVRDLGARMLMVQEEERRRVGRELHDDFSQRLALLAIDLEQLAQRPPATRQEWDSRIRAMWSQTQELGSDVHRLSYQLHPSKLEDLGLVAAVRGYCSELSRQKKLDIQFIPDTVPESLPADIALCLYRIVQEALHNVVKHSGAKAAVVEFKGTPAEVQLEVSDAGIGFDTEALKGNEGLGLIGMQERVLAVKGEIAICSHPGAGTRVRVKVPLLHGSAGESPCGISTAARHKVSGGGATI